MSLGPTGQPIAPAGDSTVQTDLPPVALSGTNGVNFTRLASAPDQEGYDLEDGKVITAE